MDQTTLNTAKMDDWARDDMYEECFRLPLTAKHELVVGKWVRDGEWGVDLRRWSYNEGRMLRMGLTLNSDSWQRVFAAILALHEQGAFTTYGDRQPDSYESTVEVDENFVVKTELFDQSSKRYLNVSLQESGQLVWIAYRTPAAIIIRFDVISDFIVSAQDKKLVSLSERADKNQTTDPKTGRRII